MAEVRAFRAVRYSERLIPELGRLIAPPYDVSRPDLVDSLLALGPYNMVHLEHVRPDPGDDPHQLAAARYRSWMDDGLFQRERTPALYRYDHTFTIDGRRLTRRGLFALVRLTDWHERVVLPHEGTFPGPVRERHRRLRAVRANLSPLYLLARDPSGDLRSLLAADEQRGVVEEAVDPEGEVHRVTAFTDPAISRRLAEICAPQRLYVADGHHRYEAALAYRDERRAAAAGIPSDSGDQFAAHEFVLALISDADDPSIVILPTHRLVRGLSDFDPMAVRAALERWFDLEPMALSGGRDTRGRIEAAAGEVGAVCVVQFAGESGGWLARTRSGAAHAALLPPERSAAWRALPTAILEHVILGDVLGLIGERRFTHVSHTQDTNAAIAAVAAGEAHLALMVRPSTVADLIAVADAGDRMPPKSTYFSPKVPAGLVIHDLE